MSESVNKWKSLQVQEERISSPPPVVILVIKWNLMKHFYFSQANNDENLERERDRHLPGMENSGVGLSLPV